MTRPSTRAADAVDALADHIAQEGSIKFGKLTKYLETRGIDTAGDEELTGEHVNQPHVSEGTTLLGGISDEYVHIVEALFKTRPVMLKSGDLADFRRGEE